MIRIYSISKNRSDYLANKVFNRRYKQQFNKYFYIFCKISLIDNQGGYFGYFILHLMNPLLKNFK